jgi:hypothetical protein
VLHAPPRKSANISPMSHDPDISTTDHNQTTPIHSNSTFNSILASAGDSVPEPVESPFIPIFRSVDKVSSSLPHTISMTEDYLRSCVGFRCIDTLKRYLKDLYQPTIHLHNTPPDAILDPGYLATLCKKDRNTTHVPRPDRLSIGNVNYGLLCVDRFSRMTYMYPLQNLTTDIQKQLESFFAHLGMIPKCIVMDFDL